MTATPVAHEPSAWLASWLDGMMGRLRSRELRYCGHTSDMYLLAVWRPDVIRCTRCYLASGPQLEGDADFTCDRCGTVDDYLHTVMLELPSGPGLPVLRLLLGLCGDCYRAEVSA